MQVQSVSSRGQGDAINPNFVQESCFFLVSDYPLCSVMDDQRWFISQNPPIYFAHNALHFSTGNETGSPPIARRCEKKNYFQLFNFATVSLPLLYWSPLQRTHVWTVMNVFHKQTSRVAAADVNFKLLHCASPLCALSLWVSSNNQHLANFLCLPIRRQGLLIWRNAGPQLGVGAVT